MTGLPNAAGNDNEIYLIKFIHLLWQWTSLFHLHVHFGIVDNQRSRNLIYGMDIAVDATDIINVALVIILVWWLVRNLV